jgi:hypothetical protein
MKKKYWIIGSIVLIIILFFALNGSSTGQYDEFAQCLTTKEAKMFGAFWCPHCQDQKKLFGSSWKYINYIECSSPDRSSQLQICKVANIEGYPTWEFQDGTRISGLVTLKQLSSITGCPLNSIS